MPAMNCPLAFIGDLLAPGHLLLIMFVALLIFGKRLPEVARSLGKSFGEFKKGLQEGQTEFNAMVAEKPDQQNPPPRPAQTTTPPADPAHLDNANKTA